MGGCGGHRLAERYGLAEVSSSTASMLTASAGRSTSDRGTTAGLEAVQVHGHRQRPGAAPELSTPSMLTASAGGRATASILSRATS